VLLKGRHASVGCCMYYLRVQPGRLRKTIKASDRRPDRRSSWKWFGNEPLCPLFSLASDSYYQLGCNYVLSFSSRLYSMIHGTAHILGRAILAGVTFPYEAIQIFLVHSTAICSQSEGSSHPSEDRQDKYAAGPQKLGAAAPVCSQTCRVASCAQQNRHNSLAAGAIGATLAQLPAVASPLMGTVSFTIVCHTKFWGSYSTVTWEPHCSSSSVREHAEHGSMTPTCTPATSNCGPALLHAAG
jgi:hypothetical protein